MEKHGTNGRSVQTVVPGFLMGKHGTGLSNERLRDGIVCQVFLMGKHTTNGTAEPFCCPGFLNGGKKGQTYLI